jgi:hypothetical protein
MQQITTWLTGVGLRKIIPAFFATLLFLAVPAFNAASQAQAALPVIQADQDQTVDRGTIKRIQQKAEDLGDGAQRDIGDTGLKNLRRLGENIPETIELKARQTGVTFDRNESNKKARLDEAQQKAERNAR